jgi:hypothetical protein
MDGHEGHEGKEQNCVRHDFDVANLVLRAKASYGFVGGDATDTDEWAGHSCIYTRAYRRRDN